jgi:excisionase family DNA binding protein
MLTVKEAAQRLGLKTSTLRAWIWKKKIAYVKLSRSVRIDPLEIERLIEMSAVQPHNSLSAKANSATPRSVYDDEALKQVIREAREA